MTFFLDDSRNIYDLYLKFREVRTFGHSKEYLIPKDLNTDYVETVKSNIRSSNRTF